MTKKNNKRAVEALRRLGAHLEPDKNYYCHHRTYGLGERCKKEPARMREWFGVKQWYCAEHDPIRIEHERKNRKKREEEKRARWKQMERERKA